MSVYSFGIKSPLKFEIDDEFANAYNDAVDDFFTAQQHYSETHGKKWEPEEPLYMKHSTVVMFNAFAKIMQISLDLHGKPVSVDDIHEDHLTKN